MYWSLFGQEDRNQSRHFQQNLHPYLFVRRAEGRSENAIRAPGFLPVLRSGILGEPQEASVGGQHSKHCHSGCAGAKGHNRTPPSTSARAEISDMNFSMDNTISKLSNLPGVLLTGGIQLET